jgi:hypothetical protein
VSARRPRFAHDISLAAPRELSELSRRDEARARIGSLGPDLTRQDGLLAGHVTIVLLAFPTLTHFRGRAHLIAEAMRS